MERNITRYRVRRRSRISRAVGMLVALVLMITIAPIASAMSPVTEIDQGALTSEDAGTGILLEDDIAEKLREILYREYNWRDQRSASVNPATASEQAVDDLFAHMEQYPALYLRATIVGIDAVAEGSNTLDDYRSPVSSELAGRAIHSPDGEGYFSGVVETDQGTAQSGGGADTLDNLRAAPAPGNDTNVTSAEDLQFIEQNTQLPGQSGPNEDETPVYSGRSDVGY